MMMSLSSVFDAAGAGDQISPMVSAAGTDMATEEATATQEIGQKHQTTQHSNNSSNLEK
jgi:hypothetical protein